MTTRAGCLLATLLLLMLLLLAPLPAAMAQETADTVAEGKHVRATLLTPTVSAQPQQAMVAEIRLENLAEGPVAVRMAVEGPGGKWSATDPLPVTLAARGEPRATVTVPLTLLFHPGGGVGRYDEAASFRVEVHASPEGSEAPAERLALTLEAHSAGTYVPAPSVGGGLLAAGVAVALSSSRARSSSPR